MKEETSQHTERKEQILSAAYRLFMSAGYETTTIQDIIREVGIAKGTFYHYFSSKEELLSELAQWQFEGAAAMLDSILKDPDLSALEKFEQLGENIGMWKVDNFELILSVARTLYHPDNLRLRHTFNQYTKTIFVPTYTAIIRQGVEEGVFDVRYPEETAEMIILLSFGVSDEFVSIFLKMQDDMSYAHVLERKLWSLERSIERLLGAEEHTLSLYKPEQIASFTKEARNDRNQEH
jgi:AcrR family transcriptional regulator